MFRTRVIPDRFCSCLVYRNKVSYFINKLDMPACLCVLNVPRAVTSTFAVHSAAENGQSTSRQIAEVSDKEQADQAPFHIPSLDGIRAFAFLIVFTAHAGLGDYIPGHLGLSLFFFLTGCLIMHKLPLIFSHTHIHRLVLDSAELGYVPFITIK